MPAKKAAKEPVYLPALPPISAQEAQVIRVLRSRPAVSRTDIARLTHWSRPKVTTVVDKLIGRGFLQEGGEGDSEGGRRPSLLRFHNDLGYLIGVDIGATSIDLVLADLN